MMIQEILVRVDRLLDIFQQIADSYECSWVDEEEINDAADS